MAIKKQMVLRTEGIYKSFASTKALVNVNIELAAGEVLGLIGENGSGKSTLSTIIAGVQNADKGKMFLDGKEYHPSSISDAMRLGISMVVQEQGTLNGISVAANIFAGKEQLFSKFGILDTARMYRETKKLLDSIGVSHIAPDVPVDRLSFEDRKLLEVARAEFNNPRILLVDETTTALGKEGRGVMYAMINRLRGEGKSVIFISHDIDELLQICDKVTVLRDGAVVDSLAGEAMRAGAMKKMMVGRDVPENMYRTDFEESSFGEVVLEGKHISHFLLNSIFLELHRGEILGIGGLTDCGMHELGKVLFGLIEPDVGIVMVNHQTPVRSARVAIKNRMGYVSKNRDTEALMAACSIKDNMCLPMLPRLKKFGLISPRAENMLVEEWSKTLSIKMRGPKQYVLQLSGGNKQKVSISKWLACDADIFIFDCPTRGIDIGVKSDIYQLLDELRKQGKAILMISEELPELIGMSDRILILKEGRVNGEFSRTPGLSETDLIEYMI
jgi:ribose transport system ATP-binding protein